MVDDERSMAVAWCDPATVAPGALVVVNMLWSPLPLFEMGHSWDEPPDDPRLGSWSAGSRMAPSFHDAHPARWSRLVKGLALLFQDRPEYLLVESNEQVHAVPHGLWGVVALPVTEDERKIAVNGNECGAEGPEGRACSVVGPHASHRTDFPYEWWPNEKWVQPHRARHGGPGPLTDMARRLSDD